MTTGRFHSEPTPSAHSLLSDSRPSGVVCDALGTCKGRAQPTRIALIAPWSPPPPVGAPINLHRVGTRDRDAFPITSNSASIQSSKSHPSALPRSSYSSYARCRIFCWISCADTTGCFPEMGVGCRFFIVVFPLFAEKDSLSDWLSSLAPLGHQLVSPFYLGRGAVGLPLRLHDVCGKPSEACRWSY